MTATIENFTDFHIKLDLGHHKVHFFVFNDEPLDFARAKIATLRPVLERIPPDHINGIAPILLLKERPLGGTGGGTMTSIENLHARNESVNSQRTELWGASYEVIEQVVLRFGRFGGADRGIHFIPLADWRQSGFATTVIHECAHGIDNRFSLHRRAAAGDPLRAGANLALSDFPNHLAHQACGHGTDLNRRAVNAYVAMITGFRGVTAAQQRQILTTLRRSNAFNGVPTSWWRETFPSFAVPAA